LLDSGATGLAAGAQAGPYVLTGADVVTGMSIGDIIELNMGYTGIGAVTANNIATAGLQTTTFTANSYNLIRGSWAADTTIGAGTFVVNAVGNDTLFVYDADVTTGAQSFQSIVLVGTAATLAGTASILSAGIIDIALS
jgi:hypothetical protein